MPGRLPNTSCKCQMGGGVHKCQLNWRNIDGSNVYDVLHEINVPTELPGDAHQERRLVL